MSGYNIAVPFWQPAIGARTRWKDPVQTNSLELKRDQWRPLLVGAWLTLLLMCGLAATPALSQESGEAKPKPRGYDPEAVKHYNRGLELQNSGFLNKAVDEYKAAIKADERLEQAYSNLGLIYIAQKNFSKAKESFDKALAIKPNRPTSLNGLASVLYSEKQTDQAIETWRKAIKFSPRFSPAYSNLGMALVSEKNYTEALDAFVKAVSITPDLAEVYYRMGLLMMQQKHPAQAEALLEKSLSLSPESEFARDARKQLNTLKEKFAKDAEDEKRPMGLNNSPTFVPRGNSNNTITANVVATASDTTVAGGIDE